MQTESITATIAGKEIILRKLEKSQLKGLSVGDVLLFDFYSGKFGTIDLLFVKPKGNPPSPRSCYLSAQRIEKLMNHPVVFILKNCPYYERQRLIEKGVFFVIGDKFANLPTLVANERGRMSKPAQKITPVAQYLLLYHLQIESLEGLAARDLERKVPYSYESIALGITCLADLAICEKLPSIGARKVMHFELKGHDLWNKAQNLLISPIESTVFCDSIERDKEFSICGINALAHYTTLVSDKEQMIMMSPAELRHLKKTGLLRGENEYDGDTIIEAWKYPNVTPIGESRTYVDKLSLALSLKNNEDPRVEGEVERMINEMRWMD